MQEVQSITKISWRKRKIFRWYKFVRGAQIKKDVFKKRHFKKNYFAHIYDIPVYVFLISDRRKYNIDNKYKPITIWKLFTNIFRNTREDEKFKQYQRHMQHKERKCSRKNHLLIIIIPRYPQTAIWNFFVSISVEQVKQRCWCDMGNFPSRRYFTIWCFPRDES